MPSAFQFCCMGMKRGCYTVITSELLKPSTFDVYRGFSAYVGGTKSHISTEPEPEPTAAPWSARLCRDSCDGLVTSSECHPTASLDVFYMDNSPTASACVEHQRNGSLITWKPFWRNVTFRLTNWRSWQWTGLRGEMPVRLVFQHTVHDRPQPGCRGLSCTQAWDLQRDSKWYQLEVPRATKFVLLTRSSKSSPKSQNIVAQRLRRIDGQLQGKTTLTFNKRDYCRLHKLSWNITILNKQIKKKANNKRWPP